MLWFKLILGLKFFELVSILFAIVPDYRNEYTTKENRKLCEFQKFCTKTKFKPQHRQQKPLLSFLLLRFKCPFSRFVLTKLFSIFAPFRLKIWYREVFLFELFIVCVYVVV